MKPPKFNRPITPILHRAFRYAVGGALALGLAGCATTTDSLSPSRKAMIEAIKREAPGDYFVGRRYYKEDYKFWGYVRKPGQPWTTARLAMFNEQTKLAPDRAMGRLGSDHGYEYKLYGHFSDNTVYEPASNGRYPEFVLTGYELRSVSPAPIFRSAAYNNPARRIIAQPY
jgi:hypothetical protein